MRSVVAALLNHFRGTTTTLCGGWRVVRTDAQVFGFTTWHKSFAIAGVTYDPAKGLDVSGTETTDTLSVPTVDVTFFREASTEAEILAGVWDNAEVTMFQANYNDIPTTFDVTKINVLRYGNLGRVYIQGQLFRAELRGLVYRFEKQIARVYTTTCPWQLGDAVCTKNGTGLQIASFTFAGTITSVGGNAKLRFSASGLAQRNGIFNQGTITFTSGANAGLKPWDIRRWWNKEFLLERPLPYDVAVGNTFSAIWGDDKTFKTCRFQFNNVGQYGGMIYLPGIDELLTNPISWEKRPLPPRPPDDNPDNEPPVDSDGGDADSPPGDDPGEGGGDGGS